MAESGQPRDVGIAAEPGQLPFSILARFDLRRRDGLRYRKRSADKLKRLLVAERFKRLFATRAALGEQMLDLFDQAGTKHFRGSRIQSFVEAHALRLEAEFQNAVSSQRFRGRGRRQRIAGEHTNFERAGELLHIAGMNAGSRKRVKASQQPVERSGALGLASHEPRADRFVAPRQRRQAAQECAQIESGAAGKNRQMPACSDSGDDPAGIASVIAGGINLGGLKYVDHVVGNPVAFGCRKFRRADVESPIELERVAVDDFSLKTPGYVKGESALAGAGRAGDDDQGGNYFRQADILKVTRDVSERGPNV